MRYDPIPERPSDDTGLPPRAAASPPAEEVAPAAPERRKRLRLLLAYPLLTALVAAATGIGVAASISRPEVDSLNDFVPRLITQIHDAQGQVIRSYSRENRVLLEESELPELLANAVVAVEDANFYQHGGIDLRGILRAVVKNLRAGQIEEGASTLTMQLARDLFALTRERDVKRKVEEAFLAVELEKRFSKQQILTLYCNMVNLGHGNYGMESAANHYFNKSVGELTLAEAATLAGIPQRPNDHSVYRRPELVVKRRNVVLQRMHAVGYITREQMAAAQAEPLLVTQRRRQVYLGPYFSEDVRRYLISTYGETELYDRGLQVHTTLDRDIQRAAETALREQLLTLDHGRGWRGAKEHLEADDLESRELPSWSDAEPLPGQWLEGLVLEAGRRSATVKAGEQTYELGPAGIEWTGQSRPDRVLQRGDVAWFRLQLPEEEGEDEAPILVLEQEPEMEAAALVVESATGAVRAMVGGWDYDRTEFNRATQAHRQVGSAFKPFVFGAALESGFTAADTVFDGPALFVGADNLESYSPRNYYRQYYGIVTLRRALEGSYNVSSVKLLDLVGIDRVVDFTQRCGVGSALPPYPSLALGTAELTPLELAGAYATFVNNGIYVEPYLIERITSRDGRLIEEHLPRAHKAIEPAIAHVMTSILRGVAVRGTAASLAQLELVTAGKTGTTNLFTDAWFVGFTPRYTILSWVGYDKKRFLGKGMTGARAALPIWRGIVERGLADGWLDPEGTFEVPPGLVEVEIERHSGLLPGPGAEETITEIFVEGTEPERKYSPEQARTMALPWYLQEPFYLPKEGERMPSDIVDWTAVVEVWKNKEKRGKEGKGGA